MRDGYCTVHHPTEAQDMKALGAKGGRSGETALRKAVRDDDSLRDLARQTLEWALRGEQVDKQQLDAARSLFSYRADSPPAPDATGGDYAGPVAADGRRPTSLAEVVRFALSISEHGAVTADLIEACREVVDAAGRAP